MKNFDKKFKKALMYYEKGNLEEALNICEKILEKEYSNEDVLALEGNLLYLLGNLDDAKVTWKINADYNNNEEAKKHLENIEDYKKDKMIYNEAVKYINSNNYHKAMEKLSLCSKNNFNKINVSKAIEECSKNNASIPTNNDSSKIVEIKKVSKPKQDKMNNSNDGSKKSSNDISENNLKNSIDDSNKKENLDIIEDEKKENEYANFINIQPKEPEPTFIPSKDKPSDYVNINIPKKGLKVSVVVGIAGVVILVALYSVVSNLSFTSASEPKEQTVVANKTTIEPQNKQEAKPEKKPETNKVELKEELNTAISNSDFNKIYELLSANPKDKVPSEDISTYDQAVDLMKTQGIKDFYEKGLDLFKNKNYEDALSYFQKALNYSEGNYLDPHIIYFIATSNDNLKKTDEAMKYYDMYLNKYKTDTYAAECTYKLALLYKDKDKELSKKYASQIEDNFSDTIYYNDSIIQIIYNYVFNNIVEFNSTILFLYLF